MKFIEYGKQNKETIILLHGGGLSWWNYREEAEMLQNEYHVILPILDGHVGSDRDFVSIEENATQIISYIDEECGGFVLFMGGLSLGGQILTEILTQRKDICRYALIESALVIPMWITHCLIKPMVDISYGLIKRDWFSKLQFNSLHMRDDFYEEYYRDSIGINKDNMIAFLKANTSYTIKEDNKGIKARVLIVVGQKESCKMRRSAEKLHEIIPGSTLEILDGMHHGEFSLKYAEKYVERINRLIE